MQKSTEESAFYAEHPKQAFTGNDFLYLTLPIAKARGFTTLLIISNNLFTLIASAKSFVKEGDSKND